MKEYIQLCDALQVDDFEEALYKLENLTKRDLSGKDIKELLELINERD